MAGLHIEDLLYDIVSIFLSIQDIFLTQCSSPYCSGDFLTTVITALDVTTVNVCLNGGHLERYFRITNS